MKPKRTIRLEKLKYNARLKLHFESSHNPLVIPQKGHSIVVILLNKQKCGKVFKKSIIEFLKTTNEKIINRLLNKIFRSLCLLKSFEKY
jgi:hypothetical protein